MKGLLLKEWYEFKGTYIFLICCVVIAAFLGVAVKDGTFGALYIAFILAGFFSGSIGRDDMTGWNYQMLTLPISRKQIVQEKYVLQGIGMMIGIISYIILFGIGSYIIGQSGILGDLRNILILMLLGGIIPSIIGIPAFIWFGNRKARIFVIVPIFAMVFIIIPFTGLYENGIGGLSIGIIGILVLLLCVLSYFLSLRLIEKKDF